MSATESTPEAPAPARGNSLPLALMLVTIVALVWLHFYWPDNRILRAFACGAATLPAMAILIVIALHASGQKRGASFGCFFIFPLAAGLLSFWFGWWAALGTVVSFAAMIFLGFFLSRRSE